MGTEGFFTRAEASGRLPRKSDFKQDVDAATLHKLGERGVRNLNPSAHSPCMLPTGSRHPDLYVLGEAPGETEDAKGEQFIGKSGKLLRSALAAAPAKVAFDNACRTRPPNNRTPTWVEVECFRPAVTKSIEERKPKGLLLVGATAMKWALPGLDGNITVSRGRRFPIRVGSHTCWGYPVHHPAYILRMEEKDGELAKVWRRDVVRAAKECHDPKTPRPLVEDPTRVLDGVELAISCDEILEELERWSGVRTVAIDLETPSLRPPYGKRARILTVALGSRTQAVAFPLYHPQSSLTKPQCVAVQRALGSFLRGRRVIAQNAAFEMEWLATLDESLLRGCLWQDTMVQAYVLDERPYTMNLDYLCRQAIGLPLKSLSPVNRKRLASEPLREVLKYNALDAKYTAVVYHHQRKRVKAEGLEDVYRDHLRRLPTVVMAQRIGVPVDQEAVAAMVQTYAKDMQRLEASAAAREEVRQYEERYGSFSLGSTGAVAKVFQDILRRPEGKKGNKYSTDHSVLEGLREEEPLAGLVLDFRRLQKLRGTYGERFLADDPKSYVYADGRIHTQYNTVFTSTGRLSSEDPNMQNMPKRRDKAVRRMIVASPGHWLLAYDYGQIEARVLGMASLDRAFCRALWDDYDVHMHWAERIIEAWPKTFHTRGSDIKKFRSEVKNQWVFPQFYGSSHRSCARSLDLPERVAADLAHEFWDMFAGVKKWQRRVLSFYEKHGYVECLTGRRRRAPLSYNRVINSPIQGTASDIVIDAMNRIGEYAEQSEKPWLHPVLNVHDDLTFLVPDSHIEEATELVANMMLSVPYDWVNVPITVEAERGRNWYEMEEVGVFRSKGNPPAWV